MSNLIIIIIIIIIIVIIQVIIIIIMIIIMLLLSIIIVIIIIVIITIIVDPDEVFSLGTSRKQLRLSRQSKLFVAVLRSERIRIAIGQSNLVFSQPL